MGNKEYINGGLTMNDIYVMKSHDSAATQRGGAYFLSLERFLQGHPEFIAVTTGSIELVCM